MPTVELRIGEALAHLRRERGLSQRDLAQRRKVIPQSISKVETQNPTVRTIEEYLSALGATPEDFIRALAATHDTPLRESRPEVRAGESDSNGTADEAFDRVMDAMHEFRRFVRDDPEARSMARHSAVNESASDPSDRI